MMQRLLLLLALVTLSACARATVPTVEEGWVPIDEWNSRVKAAHRAAQAQVFTDAVVTMVTGSVPPQYANSGGTGVYVPPPRSLRTTCYHGKRYTRCTTY